MSIRRATLDDTKNPPMQYLVADGCPKLAVHEFYACAVIGPAVEEQGKPAIRLQCARLGDLLVDGRDVACVECRDVEAPTGGVHFGIPSVSHLEPRYSPEVNDGSEVD